MRNIDDYQHVYKDMGDIENLLLARIKQTVRLMRWIIGY